MRFLLFSILVGGLALVLGLTGFTSETTPTSDWQNIAQRCHAPSANEDVIYGNDYRWDMPFDEMTTFFETMYNSPKRLFNRAYYDAARDSFILPFDPERGGNAVLPKRLIESVRHHIETGLQREYIHFPFFPDMGHSHLLIPDKKWLELYKNIPVAQMADFYSKVLADSDLKILYHTAEQLKMRDADKKLLDNPKIQWRFYTRNMVGENRSPGAVEIYHNLDDLNKRGNAMSELKGHYYYGGGFHLSAHKEGCFPYLDKDGKTIRYFDISLSDLPYKDTGNDGGF